MIVENVIMQVRVQPMGIKKKYPNYQFNYESPEDFARNTVLCLSHRGFENGYEVANVTNKPLSIGDTVSFVRKSGYMGKHSELLFGKITKFECGIYSVTYIREGRKITVSRKREDIAGAVDLIKEYAL